MKRSQHGDQLWLPYQRTRKLGLAGQFLLSVQGFRILVCRVLHPYSPLTQLPGHPQGPPGQL